MKNRLDKLKESKAAGEVMPHDILVLNDRLKKLYRKQQIRELEIIPLQISYQIFMMIPASVILACVIVDKIIPPFTTSPTALSTSKHLFFESYKDISKKFLKPIKDEQELIKDEIRKLVNP